MRHKHSETKRSALKESTIDVRALLDALVGRVLAHRKS
jgi:hypothetical protein